MLLCLTYSQCIDAIQKQAVNIRSCHEPSPCLLTTLKSCALAMQSVSSGVCYIVAQCLGGILGAAGAFYSLPGIVLSLHYQHSLDITCIGVHHHTKKHLCHLHIVCPCLSPHPLPHTLIRIVMLLRHSSHSGSVTFVRLTEARLKLPTSCYTSDRDEVLIVCCCSTIQ